MMEAFGFPCPKCGHIKAKLMQYIKNEVGEVIGFTLYCMSCEHVWNES